MNNEESLKKLDERTDKPNSDMSRYWKVMTFYERFEHLVALVLSSVITIIIIIALWQLIKNVFSLLVFSINDPLDHNIFQLIFGMIMTLLIALEFNHSILKVLDRQAHIIQVKTVILIAQLALARKFIILDITTIGAAKLAALGFSVLVLGILYWLLQERDDKIQKIRKASLMQSNHGITKQDR